MQIQKLYCPECGYQLDGAHCAVCRRNFVPEAARPDAESVRCSGLVGDCERRKRQAFERWMDAIERRLTAQEEEDAARKEYSAADDAHSRAAKSPTDGLHRLAEGSRESQGGHSSQ